jgi:hypothetical protein
MVAECEIVAYTPFIVLRLCCSSETIHPVYGCVLPRLPGRYEGISDSTLSERTPRTASQRDRHAQRSHPPLLRSLCGVMLCVCAYGAELEAPPSSPTELYRKVNFMPRGSGCHHSLLIPTHA